MVNGYLFENINKTSQCYMITYTFVEKLDSTLHWFG